MDKKTNISTKEQVPFTGYSREMDERIDQITLELFRKLLGDPNMTVQQMKEMNNRPRPNTINVTFLKKK